MIISVEATTIEMIKRPQLSVEGKVAQYMCETDSAHPHSPSVLWYMDDTLVGVNDKYTIVDNTSLGENHGKKTDSTLRFTIKREMNMKKVTCVLGNDDKKMREHTLNVKCKYFSAYTPKDGYTGFSFLQ